MLFVRQIRNPKSKSLDFSISPKSNQLPGHYYHRSQMQPIHTNRGPNASIIINYVRNGGILLSCQNCKNHELETANCPPIMINGIIRIFHIEIHLDGVACGLCFFTLFRFCSIPFINLFQLLDLLDVNWINSQCFHLLYAVTTNWFSSNTFLIFHFYCSQGMKCNECAHSVLMFSIWFTNFPITMQSNNQ